MYETMVTMAGRMATAASHVTFDDGGVKANFRLASTERRFDRGMQQWVDGARLFLTVVCWRTLAERVLDTLRVGDPVIVRGRLRAREYEKDGQVHSVIEIEATSIGPDLARCSVTVSRRTTGSERPSEGGGAEPDDVDQQGSAAPTERARDEAAVGV